MKQIINTKHLSTVIFFLSIVVLAKLIWLAISLLFLPNSGVEYTQKSKAKALYYRVRLTNASAVIAPVKKTVRKSKPVVSSMRGIKLLALYNASDALVVTVAKGSKTKVLGKGEAIDGFVLSSAGPNYAIFTKAGKEFKLSLIKVKSSGKSKVGSRAALNNKKTNKDAIVDDGGVKRITRDLLTSYTKNVDKIWRDIGISENKISGKINGFKINFVKRGSDFEKLGLKRGDILMGVNGEELNSYGAAMGIFKDINNIENLTLTVQRNGVTEELEYEIK